MPDKIKKIKALEILDSRGEPTLQVEIELANGLIGQAAVPSGASTGIFEAHELRDNDPFRYGGKGVLKAVANVNDLIARELVGLRVTEQKKIDQLMIDLDGTKNKSKLGANAILGVSLALAQTAAKSTGQPLYRYLRSLYNPKLKNFLLPTPVVNVINGGKHASSNINLQEFWIVPHKAPEFKEKLQQASGIFHALGELLHSIGYDTDLGNEGGYAPNVKSHREVFDLLIQAIESAGYEPREDIVLGIDAGSSVFYDSQTSTYNLKLDQKVFSSRDFIDYYSDLVDDYPLEFLEDPLAEEDWENWQIFTKNPLVKQNNIKLIGDDLFVTNKERLQKGIAMKVANSILIKPNQIGTLSETLETISLAQKNNYQVIVSHRSGETTDTTIADLAVAVNAQFIKTGSTARGERIAKYNRLLSIEEDLK
ncbi:phosphopyruvate hydratase [Candidatus Nomurabacteria bacterium]|nr:phosphopyruvate hydratase [Candidatus Nomurabacteria bacterium]